MSHTHMTAPTQFPEAKGIRFAYRRAPCCLPRAARRCAYARNNGVRSGSRQHEPQSTKGSMARVLALMKPPASDETANVAHLQIRNFGTTKARSWALFDLR
jgi:hypothetical protein